MLGVVSASDSRGLQAKPQRLKELLKNSAQTTTRRGSGTWGFAREDLKLKRDDIGQ